MEEALKNADSENNLRLKIELGEDASQKKTAEEDAFGGLSLMEKEEPKEEEPADDELLLSPTEKPLQEEN